MMAAYGAYTPGDEGSRRLSRRRAPATERRPRRSCALKDGKTSVLNGPYAESERAARRVFRRSRRPISTRRSAGRRVVPARNTAQSRCARFGRCERDSARGPAWAAATRVARESYGKLVAFLAARDRDIPGAEDALSEALAAALTDWPKRGVPANPEGWLAVAARRRRIDAARRRRGAEEASEALSPGPRGIAGRRETETPIPDRRLALMFVCAHPAIEEAIRRR